MLDEKDKIILESLLQDCRVTITELAKRTKLTHPTILYRIKKLEEKNFIVKYDTFIDWNKLDIPMEQFFLRVTKDKQKLFEEYCTKKSFIMSVFKHTGYKNYSITSFLREEETKQLLNFLEKNDIEFDYLSFKKSMTLPYSIFDEIKIPRPEVKLKGKPFKLDETDIRILENAFNGGGKDSIIEMSTKLNISFDKTLYRYKKLKKEGYFIRNIAQPNHELFYLKYVYCVFNTKEISFEECKTIVSSTHKVLFFAKDKDSGKFMITFVIKSLEELEKSIEKITSQLDDKLLSFYIYPVDNWLFVNRFDMKRLI